jgi:hypothetical protein
MWIRMIHLAWLIMVLLCLPGAAAGVGNILQDADFEQSTADGSFPSSGFWQGQAVGYGGAACTTTAGRSGNGLWGYTGNEAGDANSITYQSFEVNPGCSYRAECYLRRGNEWISGSQAMLRVQFLDDSGSILATHDSEPLEESEESWQLAQVLTDPVPDSAVSGRYVLVLEKPDVQGISVANFDDCFLQRVGNIFLREVPLCGSEDILLGGANCINPPDFKIAVFVWVGGWWQKPYGDQFIIIEPDGSWECDITTQPNDPYASKIMAFLLPVEYEPDSPNGDQVFPEDMLYYPHVGIIRESCFRSISFSGYDWLVKDSGPVRVDPGDNYFSDSEENVHVDENGYLHLSLTRENETYSCAEIFGKSQLGYGIYRITMTTDTSTLDPSIILGFFTWDDLEHFYSYREMDVELGRWGHPNNDNAQFIVQPDWPGHKYRFNLPPGTAPTVHMITWQPEGVLFQSRVIVGDIETPLASWWYRGDNIPVPGTENTRMNLWLLGNQPQEDQTETEVILTEFRFNAEPNVIISSDDLDFGRVLLDRYRTKAVCITNLGNTAVYLDSIAITGTDAEDFYIDSRDYLLAPGMKKELKVTFMPTAENEYSSQLTFCIDGITQAVALTGSGTYIELTSVPAWGQKGNLKGRIGGVWPADYRVQGYINVYGWYSKPTYRNPLTPIKRSGSWVCNVNKSPNDKQANVIAANLVPKYHSPDIRWGQIGLPENFWNYPYVVCDRPNLTIGRLKACSGAGMNDDVLIVVGDFAISQEEIENAGSLELVVRHEDEIIYSQTVPFNGDSLASGRFYHLAQATECLTVKLIRQYWLQGIHVGHYIISIRNVDLPILRNPIILEFDVGDFQESATADKYFDEKVINGNKPLSLGFLAGHMDALTVEDVKLTANADTLKIIGALTVCRLETNLEEMEIILRWGDQEFIATPGSFVKVSENSNRFLCHQASLSGGGNLKGIIDLDKFQFSMVLTDVMLEWQQGVGFFTMSFGDFCESSFILIPE